jgi:hypothetical protein
MSRAQPMILRVRRRRASLCAACPKIIAASGLVLEPELQMFGQFGLPHAENDAYT